MTTKDQTLTYYEDNLIASDRASMLSAIDMKIARTHVWNESTGYFLPIWKDDVIEWALKNRVYGDAEDPNIEYLKTTISELWNYPNISLFYQSYSCIAYVYSLIS